MDTQNYTHFNAGKWDEWVEGGIAWGIPITHQEFLNAKNGSFPVYLTPEKPVPLEWFPPLKGANILGLASGGGQQLPVFTAHGAHCTLLDLSPRQLETEAKVAQREGYDIDIVKGDMTKPLPFADGTFDAIFHPVSNCYIQEVEPVWRECHRVLRPGGVLLAGFNNPMVYCFPDNGQPVLTNSLPYDPIAAGQRGEDVSFIKDDGFQFSHSLETQIGGQLKVGLCLTHLIEDTDHNEPLGGFFPMYIATRSVKPK